MTKAKSEKKTKGMVAMHIAMQQQALRLRKGGANYDQIGTTLEVSDGEARDLVLQALDGKILDTVGQTDKLNMDRLETLLLKVWSQAQQGNHGAIDRVLRILDRIEKIRKGKTESATDTNTTFPAFPASEATPGQAQSRTAHARFMAQLDGDLADSPLAAEYLRLRVEGWDWRKALYIAWMVLPADKRQPPTLKKLATDVLGLKSTSSIRKWRENFPEIEEQIERSALRVLRDDLSEILWAWKESAKILGSGGVRDRIEYLKKFGIIKDDGEGGTLPGRAANSYQNQEDEDLEQLVENLQS